MYVCVCICVYVCMCVCVHGCLFVCPYTYMYIHMIHMYIYIYIQYAHRVREEDTLWLWQASRTPEQGEQRRRQSQAFPHLFLALCSRLSADPDDQSQEHGTMAMSTKSQPEATSRAPARADRKIPSVR